MNRPSGSLPTEYIIIMYIKILKEDFVEKAKNEYYWNKTDKATEIIYEILSQENEKYDLSDIINEFVWYIEEMTFTDIWEETKGIFKTKKELKKHLEERQEIIINDIEYVIFADFEYDNKEKGYLLRY